MSIKTKAPAIKEDPKTAALRAQAEARAESSRRSERQSGADDATRKLLRRFGAKATMAGAPGMGSFNPFTLMPGALFGGIGSPGGSGAPLAPSLVRRSGGGQSLRDGLSDLV